MPFKNVFMFVCLCLLLASAALAEVPQMISYQGKITTPEGALIDTTIPMTFAIYTDSIGIDSLWSETQSSVVVEKGIFSVLLGGVNPIPASVFTGDIRYLGVKAGDDPEMTPRKEIVSVGYAYQSLEADTADYALAGKADEDWTLRITDTADTTLMTGGPWGISRYGNVLYGNADSTHVNLGVACTTGMNLQNYKYCTVGGGSGNTASELAATVGGGYDNTASEWAATVGGGYSNTASGNYATVGGGYRDTASGEGATVGGGYLNTASGYLATVGGGYLNTASEQRATVGGGISNTASGEYATVGGGYYNTASGSFSAIPGGFVDTVAGDYSVAAGRQVRISSDADYTFAFGRNFTTSTPNAVIFHNSVDPIQVGIGTPDPTGKLDVNGNDIRIRSSQTPASSSADGYTGEIAWDASYIYICTSGDGPGGGTDTWERAQISTW